tara:strand:- start:14492 stop:16537 length:2046 start_codon:yes stop_codon:yes gene_type:complete
MIFKKLKLENIRSYKNLKIEFPKGSVLLAGEIGSGKTSILLGLQFALFGLQPGQRGSSILRKGSESASACLELEVDGEIIILERSIKKAKNGSIAQDFNKIVVGGSTEEVSTSEMKERVMKLLNYPKEFAKKANLLYKFTVYTPQEEMKSIIQERPEIRLDTLRHIFGIDRYKRIKDNSQILLQKIKNVIKIKEVLISELNLLREKFTIENERKVGLSRETNNLDLEYRKVLLKRREIEKKLMEMKKTIEDKSNIDLEISKNKVLISGKKDLEERMRKEMILMKKQINEKVEFSEERLRTIAELFEKHKRFLEEKNLEYLELISQISVLDSKKEGSFKLKEKVVSLENCPTCFQNVFQEHKDKISKKTQYDMEEIDKGLENKIILKETLLNDIKKEKEFLLGYESDKNNLQKDKIRFEYQKAIETKIKSDSFILDRISNEIIELGEGLMELEKKSGSFNGLQKSFEELKIEFEEIQKLLQNLEISLATKNKELEILKDRLGELSLEIGNKEKIREDVDYLRELQDWLSEKFIAMINLTEKDVMAKLRTEFSLIFNEWFSILTDESLFVRLDEEFTPLITNQDYEIDYEFLSGGERTAIALAYRLALNQVLNSMLSVIKTKGIVILDEPTDGFAEEQLNKMRDIFQELKAEQMILVSHEQKIEGFVDHIIRVRKDGVSSIEF